MKRPLYGRILCATLLFGACTPGRQTADTLVRCEKAVASAPDSVMRALKAIAPENLGGRAAQARYALILAEAGDRTGHADANDSLLRVAWNYYREHPQEIRRQCKTLYYQGRDKLRRGDKPGALRLFLEVEEKIRQIDEPYYTGLLYLRIGEVYHAELNFIRAYRYCREARDRFLRAERPRETAEALLAMTSAALRMRDLQRARRDCTLALELADELHDDTLVRRSLSLFATLYVVSETERIPEDLLHRIETAACCDSTSAGLCTRAQVHLLRGNPDRALRDLQQAEERHPDCEELPILSYTAFRAETAAGHYPEATCAIHRFIYLNDSLTRAALHTSAGMIEKEYFRERSAFADYRMRSRRITERIVAAAILLVLLLAGLIVRQRLRLQRSRTERGLQLLREARDEYRKLAEYIMEKRHTESRLRSMIASRFEVIDRLGKTYYERENTTSGQLAMARQVKQLIDGFAENGEMLEELEQIVDEAHDGAMRKLRNDFPRMKEADTRLLCYIFGGFSPQVISLFMEESVANIYARKSRLKSRIRHSDSPHKEFLVALLEGSSDRC